MRDTEYILGIFDFFKKRAKPQASAPEPQRAVDALRPLVGLTDAVCPYCSGELKKMPGRKTRCPRCGESMLVRTRPQDGNKVVVTSADAEVLEEQWSIVRGTHADYLAGKQRVQQEKDELAQRFGREPSAGDVRWSLLHKELDRHVRNGDWGLYRNARLGLADVLRQEGELEKALSMYAQVCYLDLNGPNNMGGTRDPAILKLHPPFSAANAMLAPGVLQRMRRIMKKQQIAESALRLAFIAAAEAESGIYSLPIAAEQAWTLLRSEL